MLSVDWYALQAERLKYEEKIAVLQETKEGVNQMLRDTWKQLQAAKEEVSHCMIVKLALYDYIR